MPEIEIRRLLFIAVGVVDLFFNKFEGLFGHSSSFLRANYIKV